jgi:hypothetical protein
VYRILKGVMIGGMGRPEKLKRGSVEARKSLNGGIGTREKNWPNKSQDKSTISEVWWNWHHGMAKEEKICGSGDTNHPR